MGREKAYRGSDRIYYPVTNPVLNQEVTPKSISLTEPALGLKRLLVHNPGLPYEPKTGASGSFDTNIIRAWG